MNKIHHSSLDWFPQKVPELLLMFKQHIKYSYQVLTLSNIITDLYVYIISLIASIIEL